MLRVSKAVLISVLVVTTAAYTAAEKQPVEAADVTQKVKDVVVPLLITQTDSKPGTPPLIFLNPSIPVQVQVLHSLLENPVGDVPLANKGIFQNFYNIFLAAYQEITKRQQALLDIINCTNCTNTGSPWINFLNAIATIPSLQWVSDPNYQSSGIKQSDTFIAATNQNGVVNGVGGSIINGEPVPEYTFSNNQIHPIKPIHKPAKLVPTSAILKTFWPGLY